MNNKKNSFFLRNIAAVIIVFAIVVSYYHFSYFPVTDPQTHNEAASNLVSRQVNYPGELSTSIKLRFPHDSTLSAKSIATSSGVITENQVCLSLGDFENNPEGFQSTDKIIQYTGVKSITFRISVLCDTESKIKGDLIANNPNYASWYNECDAFPQHQMACIVALRYE